MDKEYYKDIEKIKTIGSTYMAAVGLVPTLGTQVSSPSFGISGPKERRADHPSFPPCLF